MEDITVEEGNYGMSVVCFSSCTGVVFSDYLHCVLLERWRVCVSHEISRPCFSFSCFLSLLSLCLPVCVCVYVYVCVCLRISGISNRTQFAMESVHV
jgi:hypothetical protein